CRGFPRQADRSRREPAAGAGPDPGHCHPTRVDSNSRRRARPRTAHRHEEGNLPIPGLDGPPGHRILIMLLSQDEARFPMVPMLTATLGVKGHRPTVGTRDCKDLFYLFAVVNMITAAVHANLLESPATAEQETSQRKTRRMREAFAAHLRHVARTY